MSVTPWVKFYSSDWLAGTSGLSAAERGVYITICALIYEHNGPVPVDDARLARRCGCTKGAFRKILNALVDEGKLTVSGGDVSNRKCEEELAERQKFSEKQRANSKQRWPDKKKKTVEKQGQKNATGVPTVMPKESLPEPESDKKKTSKKDEDETEVLTLLPQPESEPQGDDEFEVFWKEVRPGPRKNRKSDARKKWNRITKTENSEVLIGAMRTYMAGRENEDPQFDMNPANWLERKMWEEVPEAEPEIDYAAQDRGKKLWREYQRRQMFRHYPEGLQ